MIDNKKARAPAVDDDVKEILAANIAAYRKVDNMSRAELAAACGVTEAAMGQYERGERTPSIAVLRNIARALQVAVDVLIGGQASDYGWEYDTIFLDNLGFQVEETANGKVNVYTRHEAFPTGAAGHILTMVLHERKKIFRYKDGQELIAKFDSRYDLQLCLKPLRELFLNALGARYYANKFFAELMTKDEIEIPELLLIEKNAIGESHKEFSKQQLHDTII